MSEHPIRILKPYEFDKRLIDRHIRQQVISTEDLEAYLASLPDLADQAEPLFVERDEPAPTEEA